MDTLDLLYGKNAWLAPLENGYKFNNQLQEYKITRNAREIPFMFNFYHKNGELSVQKTLEEANKYYFPLTGLNLTKLPQNDLDFV